MSPSQSASPVTKASKNIVEIASADPQFSTLVTAVKAAGLVETLSGPGPFTVFAPTNDAFAKLPAGTLDSLLADPAKLKAVLTYHVVSGDVKAADVVKLTSVTTVNGKTAPITVAGNVVKVGPATVTATDIAATNGTIHVIDTVLVP
ncbi:MAG: fasciclin domain-containing protein [bacterium]